MTAGSPVASTTPDRPIPDRDSRRLAGATTAEACHWSRSGWPRRPDLWATAVRAGLSMAPTGWWHRPPFLPLPDRRWLRFRLETAYGGDGRFGPDSPFDVEDLITWLEWRKAWPG